MLKILYEIRSLMAGVGSAYGLLVEGVKLKRAYKFTVLILLAEIAKVICNSFIIRLIEKSCG